MAEPCRIARDGPQGMILLRGDTGSGAIAAAVQGATGAPVPGVRRVTEGERGRALWFSPDELLLLVPHGEAAGLAAAITDRLRGEHVLAADVSDARVLFRLDGTGVREVLAKGAPVDLSPRAFGPGDLRRTRLGQVAVAFWCTGQDGFALLCFRSVADFVEDWLRLAAAPGGGVGWYPG